MKAEVYYFSGTGNSLFVAKQLAEKINANLTPIASVVNRRTVIVDADVLGIVFPTYHATFGECGIPFIVQRFASKLSGIEDKYIFAVCTHGGVPGSTIQNFSEIIRRNGGTLATGFSIRMSISYSAFDKILYALFHRDLPIEIDVGGRKHAIPYENCKKTVAEIAETVGSQRTTKLETPKRFFRLFTSVLFKLSRKLAVSRYKSLSGMKTDNFEYLIKNADGALVVGDECDGCGICAKVCPVGNIMLNNNRPEWQHNCESCYACFTWCPKAAIHGNLVEYERRYHHPDIKVSDMLWRNGREATDEALFL
jgi:ferredoxin